jgi:predicted alpha/beta superfamily hydrolase
MKKILLIVLLLISGVVPVMAQNGNPVTLPNTETFIIESENVHDDYLIYVGLPWGYQDSEENYPVLYLLDPNFLFGTVLEQARLNANMGGIPQVIVVGIGYNLDGSRPLQEYRGRDYIPNLNFNDAAGTDDFLAFITRELIPHIDETYRTDPEERALMGYSFSGEFTLFAFARATDTFNRYIAVSPAMPWSQSEFALYADDITPADVSRPTMVYISAGTAEGTTSAMKAYADILERKRFTGLTVHITEIEDANHFSAFGIGLVRGLIAAYGA